MAKLPAIVKALSDYDGRDFKTIDHIARVVREAGYIPTTKRGSGASDMTATEAANLLIALHGPENPKEAPTEIDRFRSLVPRWTGASSQAEFAPTFEIDALKQVAAADTFGEALECLIQNSGAVAAKMVSFVLAGHADDNEEQKKLRLTSLLTSGVNFANIGLQVAMGKHWADIKIVACVQADGQPLQSQNVNCFWMPFVMDVDRMSAKFYGDGRARDRQVTSSFGLPTLFNLWKTLTDPEKEISTLESQAS